MPNLLVIGGVLTGKVFSLSEEEVTIGRDGDNTFGVPDPALSRRHCAFTREPPGWRVRDLGSSNGTFVNGVQVQSRLLAEGDHVTAGASVLMYMNGSSATLAAVALDEQEQPSPTSRLDPSKLEYLKRELRSGAEGRGSEHALRALLRISTRLNSIREEAELYRTLLDLLFDAVPATEGGILLPAPGEQLHVQASRSTRGQESIHVSAGSVRRAMAEGVGLLFGEPVRADLSSTRAGSNARERALMAVPIGVRGRSPAAIYLATEAKAGFTEEHLQIVTAAGQIAATCLGNVRSDAGPRARGRSTAGRPALGASGGRAEFGDGTGRRANHQDCAGGHNRSHHG